MDGYFRPNFKNEKREFHVLSLDDCDFVPDDEPRTQFIFGRKDVCPRCGSATHITGDAPYCTDCNWDSLTDPFYEKQKCAA